MYHVQSRNRETYDSNVKYLMKSTKPLKTEFQSRNRETYDSNQEIGLYAQKEHLMYSFNLVIEKLMIPTAHIS